MAIKIRGRFHTGLLAAGMLAAGMCLAAPAAYAAPINLNASIGGVPTGADQYENFDSLALGSGGGMTPSGLSVSFASDGEAVTGAVGGKYAAPFISNSNGALFGDMTLSGANSTTYLTTGVGQAILDFPGLQRYMGILWGSVDSYNTLSFYNGGTFLGSITGTDVTAIANGDQGADGTYYVNITTAFQFDRVIATSSSYAFEFDNVAFAANPLGVPEPGEVGVFLFGLLLAGAGMWYRKRETA